ncbi:putative Alternative oxidase, mitochondrial [Cardiosporidium cionae]|uniref:Alternative oxidase, mitochondrial n=1 Tax=Cardiosporidium cionae TaxID=476202 RepID=A0ABQ7J812_9APIC|nr:putative Alternative oxidase, mitochondrial [Cardiosporidium cionae]|eukprot:KAF8820098.1 putative Alternative oxidase, mitochondrial [Cardiosporidium cionae]
MVTVQIKSIPSSAMAVRWMNRPITLSSFHFTRSFNFLQKQTLCFQHSYPLFTSSLKAPYSSHRWFSFISHPKASANKSPPSQESPVHPNAADAFPAKNEHVEEQCQLIATAHSDTVHFMKGVFNRPVSSNISNVAAEEYMSGENCHSLPHPIWTMDSVHGVEVTHFPPKTWMDRMAYISVKILRALFDICSDWEGRDFCTILNPFSCLSSFFLFLNVKSFYVSILIISSL